MKKYVMPAIVLMGGLMLAACSPAPSVPAEVPAPPAVPAPPPPPPEPMPDPSAIAPMSEDDAPHSSGERVTPAAPIDDAATESDDDAPHSSGDRV